MTQTQYAAQIPDSLGSSTEALDGIRDVDVVACGQLLTKRPCAKTLFMSSFFLRFLLITVHILHSITSQPQEDQSCDSSSTVK
jgi:hypothetical protein